MLEFRFGERGEVIGIYTLSRYRDVNGVAVPMPWACHLGDYARVRGVMVPIRGEAEWILPEGPLPYFRGRLTRIEHGGSDEAAVHDRRVRVRPPSRADHHLEDVVVAGTEEVVRSDDVLQRECVGQRLQEGERVRRRE
jgi:hypothetical protein